MRTNKVVRTIKIVAIYGIVDDKALFIHLFGKLFHTYQERKQLFTIIHKFTRKII